MKGRYRAALVALMGCIGLSFVPDRGASADTPIVTGWVRALEACTAHAATGAEAADAFSDWEEERAFRAACETCFERDGVYRDPESGIRIEVAARAAEAGTGTAYLCTPLRVPLPRAGAVSGAADTWLKEALAAKRVVGVSNADSDQLGRAYQVCMPEGAAVFYFFTLRGRAMFELRADRSVDWQPEGC